MRKLLAVLVSSTLLAAGSCGRKPAPPEAPPDEPSGKDQPAPRDPEPVEAPFQDAPQDGPAAGQLPSWIVDKPILWDEERRELAKKYAEDHYGLDTIEIVPRMIVIHWTGGKSWEGAFNTFNKAKLAGRPFLQKYGKVNVSAHYLVARDGTVFKLMPDTLMGRHVIGLNHCAVGVENVGNDDLTDEQLESNVNLVEHLATRYETIEYLIGHFEYLKFEGSALFIETHPGYRTKKKDPGKEFMKSLRELLEERGVQLHYTPQDLPVPVG